jgi:aminopeptidase N
MRSGCGRSTAAELADAFYAEYPATSDYWKLILSPGTRLFEDQVYERGAMTLQALRTEVGDDAFFQILRNYHAAKRGKNATTAEFIGFAEQVAGRQLDTLFTTWLSTLAEPPVGPSGKKVTTTTTPQIVSRW